MQAPLLWQREFIFLTFAFYFHYKLFIDIIVLLFLFHFGGKNTGGLIIAAL